MFISTSSNFREVLVGTLCNEICPVITKFPLSGNTVLPIKDAPLTMSYTFTFLPHFRTHY